METRYFKQYSPALGRDMECKFYGHAGRPVLYIPCQDGRFFDFEDFHMAQVLSPWLESGQMMVLSVDTLDRETWSDRDGDPYRRIRRHEQWVDYLTREAVPLLQEEARIRTSLAEVPGVLAFGCSLGATHAANLYFRFPRQFDGLLALSGIYTAEYGFGGYMDELVYLNSPVHYLPNTPDGHPYLALYRRHRAVLCVGQGPWELPESTYQMRDILADRQIPAWVDVWGWDCAHDWPWWYKQTAYFVPYLLGQSPS